MEAFNIVYFAIVSSSLGGVEQKILGQFDALIEIHPATHLFLISSTKPGESLTEEISKRLKVKSLVNSSFLIANPIARRKEKFSLIEIELKNFMPDNTVVYLRYPNADFIFLKFLKSHRTWFFVTEHQEIENTFSRYRFNGNYLRNAFEIIWGKSVRKYITAFVGVTEEIKDYQLSVEGSGMKKGIAIGNGIKLADYPIRIPLESNDNEIRILFVGAGFKTHGLFRLIKSISLYKKNLSPKVAIKVRVAGESHEMAYNRKLVKQEGVANYFEFLGLIEKDKLGDLFDWADIGVGSLALHRIGLSQSSTLKAREYVARGLPFFWSTQDNDIPNHLPFILDIDANDKPFDMDRVVAFAEKCKAIPNLRQQMREFAANSFSSKIQMNKLLNYLKLLHKSLHVKI